MKSKLYLILGVFLLISFSTLAQSSSRTSNTITVVDKLNYKNTDLKLSGIMDEIVLRGPRGYGNPEKRFSRTSYNLSFRNYTFNPREIGPTPNLHVTAIQNIRDTRLLTGVSATKRNDQQFFYLQSNDERIVDYPYSVFIAKP